MMAQQEKSGNDQEQSQKNRFLYQILQQFYGSIDNLEQLEPKQLKQLTELRILELQDSIELYEKACKEDIQEQNYSEFLEKLKKNIFQYLLKSVVLHKDYQKTPKKQKKKYLQNAQINLCDFADFSQYQNNYVKTEELLKQNQAIKEKLNPRKRQEPNNNNQNQFNQNNKIQGNFINNNNNQFQNGGNKFQKPTIRNYYNKQNNQNEDIQYNQHNKNPQEEPESGGFGGFQTGTQVLQQQKYRKLGNNNNYNDNDNEQDNYNSYGNKGGYLNNKKFGKNNYYNKNRRFNKNQQDDEDDEVGQHLNQQFKNNKQNNYAGNNGACNIEQIANRAVFGTNLTGIGGGARNTPEEEEKQREMPQRKKFVPPYKNKENNSLNNNNNNGNNYKPGHIGSGLNSKQSKKDKEMQELAAQYGLPADERLKSLEPKLIETIMSELVDSKLGVTWGEIAGLSFAKKTIHEIIILPMLNPNVFKGLRQPPKGLLLFGPPGTGKTMIAKAIAHECESTFFSVSASSLTSKWVGEGEKLVKTLFTIARIVQPSVIFLDEIDSLLTARQEGEQEASRRIKTQFLVELDGAGQDDTDKILLIGATNRPQELDDAARRRFVKRLYIPLPNYEARHQLITTVVEKETKRGNKYQMTDSDTDEIVKLTKGFSGADMTNLCREACMFPIRELTDIQNFDPEQIRATNLNDFKNALDFVKKSVSPKDLIAYYEWNDSFGSFNIQKEDQDN
ncbi:P-loop containing nucleoside triphosphate hydrolase [Pseudocohnilembus persalinus]|uniref:p-loop containing nucleoside triphosphate hydrolase n=1 Tax=Pseudocohnilembus persalinus TaxID=266149 RepID=A0A0V0R0Y4_PSEPJ|nr:P-loop containing nucleoside triphosphate hydrolase [Pseudocohnilembus persalinus]|eukprot:KRX07800.1 P-loop containing nucleoside triphosphate hydrolase [Pseudocohnilembus persalinus]